jgi:hypothetical protein
MHHQGQFKRPRKTGAFPYESATSDYHHRHDPPRRNGGIFERGNYLSLAWRTLPKASANATAAGSLARGYVNCLILQAKTESCLL